MQQTEAKDDFKDKLFDETQININQINLEFIKNLSHEFITPLAGILGFSYKLCKDAKTKKQYEYASYIHESGVRLLQATQALLDILTTKKNILQEKRNNDTREIKQDNKKKNIQKLRILLVDDDKIARISQKLVLKDHNCIVDVAENGQKALEKINKKHYDLLLMDVQMPVMDGITAVKNIRNLMSELKDIPIVALTAFLQEEVKKECLEVGCNAVFTKPLDQQKVKKIIEYAYSIA